MWILQEEIYTNQHLPLGQKEELGLFSNFYLIRHAFTILHPVKKSPCCIPLLWKLNIKVVLLDTPQGKKKKKGTTDLPFLILPVQFTIKKPKPNQNTTPCLFLVVVRQVSYGKDFQCNLFSIWSREELTLKAEVCELRIPDSRQAQADCKDSAISLSCTGSTALCLLDIQLIIRVLMIRTPRSLWQLL